MDRAIDRIREICRAFPGGVEKDSWGNATFRVSNRIFVWTMVMDDPAGATARFITVKAAAGDQESLVAEGHPFFSPRSSGSRGWVGVVLDDETDWTAVRELIEDSYREIAPRKYVLEFDA